VESLRRFLVFILALSLLASVSISNAISLGVEPGDRVAYDVSSQGDLELVGGELVGLTKILEIDVIGVSGNVLRLDVTYTLQNGTKLKYVPLTQLSNDSFDFWIIPANLSQGDKALPDTWVNETRTETWLGFKRGVCYAARLMRLGELTFNWTGHYDRKTGVAFSYFYGVFNGSVIQASCTYTIRSASMITEDAPLPTYSVTFDAEPQAISITIDGVAYAPLQLPKSFVWLCGYRHTFSVEPLCSATQGERYAFIQWNDGDTSASRSVTVAGDASYVAVYRTEYHLAVSSEHGSTSGSGWYGAGDSAYASIDAREVDAGFPYAWVFVRWEGDASGTDLTSETIHMDGPKTIVAVWEKRISSLVYILFGAGIALTAVLVFMRTRGRSKRLARSSL